jgi:hypothetical protein
MLGYMSVSSKVDVAGHANSRLSSLTTHLNSHVNQTTQGLKTALNGQPINDLLAMKPVAAVTGLVKNVSDGLIDGVLVGNLEVVLDSVKSQAAITRQGRA